MGALTRLDSWASALTKLGTAFDKLQSYSFRPGRLLQPEECSQLYYYNGLARKICDIYPEDAMREGFCVKDAKGAEVEKIKTKLNDLGAAKALTSAAMFGNAFGRAGVLLGVNDGKRPHEPLDVEGVVSVDYLRVIDRRDLAIARYYGNPLSSNFNTPELFTFTQPSNEQTPTSLPAGFDASVQVHESRFIWFDGSLTGQREMRMNQGWPHSKLQLVEDQLLRVGVSWDNAAQLLQIASQTIMKVDGLRNALVSEKGQEGLERRAMFVDLARSITRSLWVDKEEEVEQLNIPLAGIGDVLDRLGSMLSAHSGIPVTKLLGTMPTGLGATGAADEKSWNNRVESYREQTMKPGIDKLVACVASAEKIKGELKISFPSLDRPTEAETADTRLKVAQADHIYVTDQVLGPEEVANSRMGGAKWSMETQLEPSLRDETGALKSAQVELDADGNPLAPEDGSDDEPPTPKKSTREDASFDESEHPRASDGRWTAASSLSAARDAQRAARHAYHANPNDQTKAAHHEARARVRQRRELADKVETQGTLGAIPHPKLSSAERAEYLAKHKAAIATAQTPRARARAEEELRAARRAAGSTTVDPRKKERDLREAQQELDSYRTRDASSADRERAEDTLLETHGRHSTPGEYTKAAERIHAHNTSSSAIGHVYKAEYLSEGGDHASARDAVDDHVNAAHERLTDHLTDYAPARVQLDGNARRATLTKAKREARDRAKGIAKAFKQSPPVRD